MWASRVRPAPWGSLFMPTAAAAGASNLLLATLDVQDRALLEPHFKNVALAQYDILQEPGARIEYVYFPLNAMISLLAVLESGEAIEIAAIGREGAVGAKFGSRPPLSFARAVVQLAGTALRIDLAKFQQAVSQSLAIAELALCANDVLMANLQQSAACNAMHAIEARLARWLLHARDRHDGDSIPITQEFLSELLGVRRPTVTLAARTLHGAGLIRYRRGVIEILDRDRLQAVSCECYAVVRQNIARVLRPSN
jgi:CRP-like cAMP-binding protein